MTKLMWFGERQAFALGKIGPTAQAAVPALKQALKDKDKRVRQKATRALKQIAPSEVPGHR